MKEFNVAGKSLPRKDDPSRVTVKAIISSDLIVVIYFL